jgi:hypothetical protein
MTSTRLYGALLRLYPYDFQQLFAAEMAQTFAQAADEHHQRGVTAFATFNAREWGAVVVEAAAEWAAKLYGHPSLHGRCLPDWRLMRPPDVSKKDWFGL